ncbi:MAG: thiamine pyrophosphate-dependent enzyme [Alphaproteobacteria bacterium]|nr:thiamine pyrophosphate-dependent enzyme [Alphaproteobacteria bacterium]
MEKNSYGGKILADCLKDLGVNTVFTVPGESFLAALNGLYDHKNDINVITCRHESGAANMAEAWGKLNGLPGVVFVTRGPGACHASIGVHTAMQDSSPMIMFIGQINSKHKGREAFQEVDYHKMFGQPFSKAVFEIKNAKSIPNIVQKAYYISTKDRPGPVIISLPEDILEQYAKYKPIKPIKHIVSKITPKKLDNLLIKIEESKKPLIIIGGGDWDKDGAKNLENFANTNNIPYAVSFRRQSLVNNNKNCYIGDLSTSVDPKLIKSVKESDLILVVGARLGDMTTSGYSTIKIKQKSKIIHVYPDEKELGRVYKPIVGIKANSSIFSKIISNKKIKNIQWVEWTKSCRENYIQYSNPPKYFSEPDMGKIMLILRENMPQNTIITIDAGNFSGWIQRFWKYTKAKTQLAPTSGAMGYSIPAAISAKISQKNTPVIAFCGDGGFMMSSQELATCNQYKIKPIIIIINNKMLGTIRMHQEKNYPNRKIATDLVNPDFKLMSKSYNAHYEKIKHHRNFLTALKRSLNSNKAAVIEILIDPTQITTRQKLKDLNN